MNLAELLTRSDTPALRVDDTVLTYAELDDGAARAAIEAAEAETGLPADDPVRFGAAKLVDAVLAAAP